MKKVIRNIVYAILGILMVIAFIYLGTKDYSEEVKVLKDNELMHSYFNLVPKDNKYDVLKNYEASKFFENGTGVILLCFKQSTWCNKYASIVDKVAKETNVDLYYFDILNDRQDNSYYYQKIITAAKDYIMKNDMGDYYISVPDLYVLNQGIILGHNEETSQTIGTLTVDDYWTEEKTIEFENTLKELFIKIQK